MKYELYATKSIPLNSYSKEVSNSILFVIYNSYYIRRIDDLGIRRPYRPGGSMWNKISDLWMFGLPTTELIMQWRIDFLHYAKDGPRMMNYSREMAQYAPMQMQRGYWHSLVASHVVHLAPHHLLRTWGTHSTSRSCQLIMWMNLHILICSFCNQLLQIWFQGELSTEYEVIWTWKEHTPRFSATPC